jgi:Protein of unknown function (DUF3574)
LAGDSRQCWGFVFSTNARWHPAFPPRRRGPNFPFRGERVIAPHRNLSPNAFVGGGGKARGRRRRQRIGRLRGTRIAASYAMNRFTSILRSPHMSSQRLFPDTIALLASLVLVGCSSVPAPRCESSERTFVNDLLYFGTAKPGGVVSSEEWAAFLGTVVTPRFPAGLTSWTASGQWRSADGSLTRESSHVLNLLHAPDSTSEAAIREVVAAYKSQFNQEAVLRVKSFACVSF